MTKKDLDVKVTFSPPMSGGEGPFPGGLQVTADVQWIDATGVRRPWDASRIHIRFGSNDFFPPGPGPYPVIPVFRDKTWTVRVWVELYIGGRWQRRMVYESGPVLAYCAVDMTSPGLDQEDKHFIATLYGEGGGMSDVSDAEVARVAWCMRTRVDFARRVEHDADSAPGNPTFAARLEAVRKDFAAAATYEAVLSHPGQFKAWKRKNYWNAMDPRKKIVEHHACATLERTRRIALGVKNGTIANVDAGRGNPTFPGCFFYMTKKQLKDYKLAHPTSTRWDYAPLDPLPTTREHRFDHHWYWPLKQESPWLP